MKKVYINGICSISAQNTSDNPDFLNEVIDYQENVIPVINPNYKEYISPSAARRMAKGIKMGVVASKKALLESELNNVDAIITGTGMGCVIDSEKFVRKIINDNEQYLTPTSFIQSTHNTVGGQIALELKCKGYNFTYVHASISFESALLDAKMQIENNEEQNILIGGIDELGEDTVGFHKLVNHIKSEVVKTSELLESKTGGTIFGEGANFFVLSSKKQTSSYVEVCSIKTYNTLPETELVETVLDFLKENNVTVEDIDMLVLGNNGDYNYDSFYNTLSASIFSNTQQVYYKHLCGEYNTASSFGVWLASKIIKLQMMPKEVRGNNIKKSGFKTVLLYNQYRGENHSFTLLKKC